LSIFDLLFLFSALATIVAFFTALVCAAIGRRARALAILRVWIAAAAVYFAADLVSIWLRPLRVLYLHDPQCSDDWCFVVEGAGRDTPDSETYHVKLRIYSRAGRVDQRERGLSVYLTDAAGHRYDPAPQSGEVPLDTLLAPGQSAIVDRTFRVPATVRKLDLSMVHEGGFPIGWLIIGRSPFDKRTVVRLD
jgi:hypothetical protein